MNATEQPMQALAIANPIRVAGAAFRHSVGRLPFPAGLHALADALEDLDGAVGAIPLDRFLRSARGIGARKLPAIFIRAQMTRHPERVRDLTDGERERLARTLRRWGR